MAQSNEAPQKKEDRRVRRTKKLLTQALTQLLQEKQINEITVKELTDLADMNRGTFYLYYKDIFDMLEKIEDGLFEALDEIVSLHEHDDVSQQTKPILLDLFRFIEENQEMCRVLLSPHGDMNLYHYSFVVYGCVGVFRTWLNSKCQEPAEKMADMADAMIRRGSLSIA